LAQLGERPDSYREGCPYASGCRPAPLMTSRFFVYVLQSQTSGRFYVGHASNLEKRLQYHNSGRAPSTRRRGPWKLLGAEEFSSKAEAIRRERQIKSWKSHRYVASLLGKAPDLGTPQPVPEGELT
ncbi:MAG: GIY-YIG nuclease family protein, partial [Chloroflexota bacterium]